MAAGRGLACGRAARLSQAAVAGGRLAARLPVCPVGPACAAPFARKRKGIAADWRAMPSGVGALLPGGTLPCQIADHGAAG